MKKYMRKGFAYVFLAAMAFGMLPISQREGIGLTDNTMRVCANIKNEIKSYNDLVEATATGGTYVLTNSVVVTNPIVIPRGVELTLVPSIDGDSKLIGTAKLNTMFFVSEGSYLQLGQEGGSELVLDGSLLGNEKAVVTVSGTCEVQQANITCKNGYGIEVQESGSCNMTGGRISECGLAGLYVKGRGSCLKGGTISGCGQGVWLDPKCSDWQMTGGTIEQCGGSGVFSEGVGTMSGGKIASCPRGIYTTSGSFNMQGGVLEGITEYAMEPAGGTIYWMGGDVMHGRCTTNSQGCFAIGGSTGMDSDSYIVVQPGTSILQVGRMTNLHPETKIQLYAFSSEQPLVTAISDSIQISDSVACYGAYGPNCMVYVQNNAIYMDGLENTKNEPVASPSPTQEVPVVQETTPTQVPVSQEPTPNPTEDYSIVTEFRPELTKVQAKGLKFQLYWDSSAIVQLDEMGIYYSLDQKNYTLAKKVKGTVTRTSLTIPQSYEGDKIYFYLVGVVSDKDTGQQYETKKSYVASRYLVDKVRGTTGSYHTKQQKLVIKWKQVTNCTGYHVFLKAQCNGKTTIRRCATVSKKKNSVMISDYKIKKLFASKGKPIHIKKYMVQAFYQSGNKTAFSLRE